MSSICQLPRPATSNTSRPTADCPGGDNRLQARHEVVRQIEVIHRDVQRVLRRSDELGQCVRGVDGRLAAVGQCADFDRLYSRLAAW